MNPANVLLELIKESRQDARNIQARVYNLSTTFVVFSFAITAFILKDMESDFRLLAITVSDLLLIITLLILFVKTRTEHSFIRLTLEKMENNLIDVLDGKKTTSQELVCPRFKENDRPKFPLTREVTLFILAACVIFGKMLLIMFYLVFYGTT